MADARLRRLGTLNGFRFDAKGLGYFGAGAAAGTLGLYGPAGWAAGGAILGASNAALGGADKKQILQGAVIGGMSGIMGGAMGQWASSSLASPMISGLKIGSPILAGAINGTVGGAVGGAAGGFVGGLAITGNPDQAMQMALQGALMGAGIGAATGTINGIKYARDNGLNPWTGKSNEQYLYHYTDPKSANNIMKTGLTINERRPYVYTTDAGDLSPLQAQIELALPANRPLPTSILKIDVKNMSPLQIRNVTGNLPGYGAGGGREYIFNQSIPPSGITIIKR